MARRAKTSQPALPGHSFEYEGVSYSLRFSIKAMGALQDHYSLSSINEVAERLQVDSEMRVDDIVAIVWAGLRSHHPKVTKPQVLDMLDELGLEGMQDLMTKAFAAQAPRGRPGRMTVKTLRRRRRRSARGPGLDHRPSDRGRRECRPATG